MSEPLPAQRRRTGIAVRLSGLTLWALAAFGGSWFARDLQQVLWGWPLNFWFAAQGALVVFVLIVGTYAWWRNRQGDPPEDNDAF